MRNSRVQQEWENGHLLGLVQGLRRLEHFLPVSTERLYTTLVGAGARTPALIICFSLNTQKGWVTHWSTVHRCRDSGWIFVHINTPVYIVRLSISFWVYTGAGTQGWTSCLWRKAEHLLGLYRCRDSGVEHLVYEVRLNISWVYTGARTPGLNIFTSLHRKAEQLKISFV
jgi:hypothetical protein